MSGEVVRNFVSKSTDTELRELHQWFTQCFTGDRAKIADALAQDKEVDRWLKAATSAEEWFDMIEFVGKQVAFELESRSKSA